MIVVAAQETKKVRQSGWFIEKVKKLSHNSWFTFVLTLYFLAFVVFGYSLLTNSLVIPVSGDFVIQEIPFYHNGYDDWWTAIRTGHFPLWDESAAFGVNNIGANAFYYLFNIFFLPTLLVPREIIPQMQAFLIITKIVLAGVGMRKLLQVFKVSIPTCNLVAMAYAFCGWNLFYLWFNHFFELAVLMPFFLLAIEICLRKRNPLPLIAAVGIVAITNYFFLIAFCFTGVMYAIFRYFQRYKIMKEMNEIDKSENPHHFMHVRVEIILKGVFGFGMGILLAAFVLLPCFDAVLSNTRVSAATYGSNLMDTIKALKDSLAAGDLGAAGESFKEFFEYLLSWEKADSTSEAYASKYLLYPAISFFFPTVSCYDSPLFVNNGYDNHQASLYVFTPLMLLFLPSVMQSIKEKKISHIIAVVGIIILLFTPFAYYCFSGFTSVAYGRWQIFVVAIYCIYVAIQFEKRKDMPKWFFDCSIVFTLALQFLLIKLASDMAGTASTRVLDEDRLRYCYLAMILTFVVYVIYRSQLKKDRLTSCLTVVMFVEIAIVGNVVQRVQGITDYDTYLYGGKDNVSEEVSLASRINENDNSYFRVFSTSADRTGNNLAMTLGTRGVGTFHSVYNYNLDDFLNWSQVTYGRGGWSMGIHEKRVNLDTYLGIKYYIVKNSDTNIPFGFEEYFSTDTHSVYINTNFMELGSSFTTLYNEAYVPSENYSWWRSYSRTFRNELGYLNGVFLSSEDLATITAKYPSLQQRNYLVDTTLTNRYQTVNDGTIMIQRTLNGQLQTAQQYTSTSLAVGLGLSYGSIAVETFENSRVCQDATPDNPCYVDVQARLGENLLITLYGDNDKVLVSDRHMTHNYSKTGDLKTNRGFYVTSEVKKIQINVYDNFDSTRYLLFPDVQFQYYNDYLQNVNELQTYAVSDVEVISSDELHFGTNYNETRMVSLNIPFDKGWSLVNGKGENVDLYMANGGFISFVAIPGEETYVLSYMTPNLAIGLKITYVATMITEMYYVVYEMLKDRRRISKLVNLK